MLLDGFPMSEARLLIGGGLLAIHRCVESVLGEQIFVRALLDDSVLIKHDDEVCHADRGEPVRNQDGASAIASFCSGGGPVVLIERLLRWSDQLAQSRRRLTGRVRSVHASGSMA